MLYLKNVHALQNHRVHETQLLGYALKEQHDERVGSSVRLLDCPCPTAHSPELWASEWPSCTVAHTHAVLKEETPIMCSHFIKNTVDVVRRSRLEISP